jgi:hypothetical protein
MKKTLIILVLIATTTIFNSCKKDSNGNIIVASMSAKINNTDWSSTVRTCTKTGNTIVLTGTSIDGKTIEIKITPDLTTSNLTTNVDYKIGIGSLYKPTVNASSTDIYFALTGTVKLTQLDMTSKLVSGTFNFNGATSGITLVTISSGTFSNVSFIGS